MKEVTKQEFYKIISKLNVHPVPKGKYPYTTHFITVFNEEKGRIVPVNVDSSGYTEKFYIFR